MRLCPRCNKPSPGFARYCRRCGRFLETPAPKAAPLHGCHFLIGFLAVAAAMSLSSALIHALREDWQSSVWRQPDGRGSSELRYNPRRSFRPPVPITTFSPKRRPPRLFVPPRVFPPDGRFQPLGYYPAPCPQSAEYSRQPSPLSEKKEPAARTP